MDYSTEKRRCWLTLPPRGDRRWAAPLAGQSLHQGQVAARRHFAWALCSQAPVTAREFLQHASTADARTRHTGAWGDMGSEQGKAL
jgi:hypothetical protein